MAVSRSAVDQFFFNFTDGHTEEGVSFGSAAADRLVFVGLAGVSTSEAIFDSVTIGGVTATEAFSQKIFDTGIGQYAFAAWWWAAVPTGTTGDIAFSYTDSNNVAAACEIYRIVGANVTTPVVDTGGSAAEAGGNRSTAVDMGAGSASLGAHYGGLDTAGVTATWTNLTEDADFSSDAGGILVVSTFASRADETDAGAVTVTVSQTNANFLPTRSLAVVVIQASAANEYDIAADVGSFALTGATVALRYNRKVVAAAGSFSLSGTAVSLEYNRKLVAENGSFALSGTDATLRKGVTLVADPGSFSLAGTAASLEYNRKLLADPGSFALTGDDVTLTYTPLAGSTYTLVADPGSFALSGAGVSLTYTQVAPAFPVGGASYLTREEYEASLARYRKLENARKDIKRRDRDKWARVMGRASEDPAPEPQSAPVAAGRRKQLTIAPIPRVAAPDPRLATIAEELKAVKAKLEEHRAAEAAEDDDLETILMLVA